MYKVFTDFHHSGLLQSLILLFEKRLGGQVYRPIGTRWFDKGYWKVYDHPATVQQYLGIGSATPDGTPPLNEVINTIESPERALIFNCHDIDSGRTNKAITYEGFMSLPFDIVIASLPYHIEPFRKLCQEHPSKPKLIYQIGNAWTTEAGMAKNVMASAIINDVPPDVNFISYHQEFDTDIFHPKFEIVPENKIASFVNCFNISDHFKTDWQLFQQMESIMSDWVFKCYGGQCRDGAVGPTNVLAEEMRSCKFIWNTKAGGDGYGHIIHNAAAIGKPMIVKKSQYLGKMGEKLMIDGETCIDIDNMSTYDIVNKIKHFSLPGVYEEMCHNVYENFRKVVDFDKEEKDIRGFLLKLI